ncbi:MAG: YkgJ family cysteine cluster protein [Desulfobulbaceae bacterium]|nr:MAG: YkgJ family cysteine cluster protein [Desulfobulbaceae bacterium]
MPKIECKRCGTCCVKGGPVLHVDDLPLLDKKIIQARQLVVIRQGEPAYQPASDSVEPAACEMLKVQGVAGSWQCLFFEAATKSCTIHVNRPLECRLLQCQDPAPLLAVSGRDCLNRRDIMAQDDPAIPFIEAFTQCSWHTVHSLLEELDATTLLEIEKIIRTDLFLREEAVHSLKLSLAQELFYFGRPMFQAFCHAGVELSFERGMPRLHLR